METSTSDGRVEINPVEKGVDRDGSLRCRGKSPLSPVASRAEAAECPLVGGQVLLVLFLEFRIY